MAVKYNKRMVIAGGAAAGVLAVALVGTFIYPGMAAASYTDGAKEANSKVLPQLDKVYSSFEKDVFTKTDQEIAAGKADVKSIMSSIEAAEAALAQNRQAATNLSSAPVSFNGTYSTAKELRTAQTAFYNDAQKFLADYKAMANYINASLDIAVESEAAGTDLVTFMATSDYDIAMASLQTTIDKLKKVVATTKKQQPPQVFAELHAKELAETEKLIKTLQDIQAAEKAEDLEKADAAYTQLEIMIASAGSSFTKELIKIQNESGFAKSLKKIQQDQQALSNRF